MPRPLTRFAAVVALLLLTPSLALCQDEPARNYPSVFSWPFLDADMSPRGGTTEGPAVETVTETTEAFERLRADTLSKFERDRRAILAMAGTYRLSFDFLETVGYAPGFEPARPYQSWGTEHIYVVEDAGERISLQHVLIMSVIDGDGEVMGPFVTKHWRQDWEYENPEVHTYRGYGTWARETRDAPAREGLWSQTVWQVDDSPRYAAWGEWRHTPERSWWTSGKTWRPLPRREFSVRDDYDVLAGTNTHIVLPTGWVQEEHNVKAVLAGPGEVESRLAREIGIARYERIRDFDTTPGDDYWSATSAFWGEVRAYWARAMEEDKRIRLRSEVDGRQLFQPLFERAQAIFDGEHFTAAENRSFIVKTLTEYRADPDDRATMEY
ncbi:MAG: DUF6607 family protein [Pseudohongiellaceae bacterium]